MDLEPPWWLRRWESKAILFPSGDQPASALKDPESVSLTTPVPSGFILKMSSISRVCGIGAIAIEGQFGASWLPDRQAAVRRFARHRHLVGEVLIGYPGLHESVRVLPPEHYAAVLPCKRGLRWRRWCDQDPRGPANTHNQDSQHRPAVSFVVYASRYLLLPCGTTGCMSLPSPRVITPALSAPAVSAAPIPARETGRPLRASTDDPGVRTRGIVEPTLLR